MKNVLVINYSQSGQLDEILDNFLLPFESFEIDRVKIQLKNDLPLPWTSEVFFDTMPSCVHEDIVELLPFQLKKEKYDLIIIGYQPWFLSPSLPITALFNDPKFKSTLKDTPVVTVIGARNMWLNSQDSIVPQVESSGGKMVANVPYIDRVQNHVSALTILHWMLTGKKTKKWGLLPVPGVAQREIDEAHTLGALVAKAAETDNYIGLQKTIIELGGFTIESSIILIESRAKKLFTIWADLIKRKGTDPKKRAFWVSFFKWYLVIALFIVSPLIIFIHTLMKPFNIRGIRRKRDKYLYLGIEK